MAGAKQRHLLAIPSTKKNSHFSQGSAVAEGSCAIPRKINKYSDRQMFYESQVDPGVKAPGEKVGDCEFESRLSHESQLCDFEPITAFQRIPPHKVVGVGKIRGARHVSVVKMGYSHRSEQHFIGKKRSGKVSVWYSRTWGHPWKPKKRKFGTDK